MLPLEGAHLLLLLLLSIPHDSLQVNQIRKFTNKYNFPGVTTGIEEMVLKLYLQNATTNSPYVTMNMTRTTELTAFDLSCRYIPVRFAPYNLQTFEMVHGKDQITLEYIIKDRNMIAIADFPMVGYDYKVLTAGYRLFVMANQGLEVYFLESVLGKK